jgi:hypothetical protein
MTHLLPGEDCLQETEIRRSQLKCLPYCDHFIMYLDVDEDVNETRDRYLQRKVYKEMS